MVIDTILIKMPLRLKMLEVRSEGTTIQLSHCENKKLFACLVFRERFSQNGFSTHRNPALL